MGSLLVQLAKSAGATVVAAAGGSRKTGVARDLGADEVVDYTAPGWTDGVAPVDVVLDGVGGDIARAAFDMRRARDVGHRAALCQLANRLVGILPGCLKTRSPYEATAWSHRSGECAA
ncbi:zinc-binding dehydrogenase [Nonomuraea insulae]|uniref:Zinc-binding dehydrogenase n=1 Tax=Nonomuraea insulae TaxID=1616787 RepID=A0ABW1D799_9ACTN